MFRKALTILLAFVYLFMAAGMTVNIHRCMGRVTAFNIGASSESCACRAMAVPPGCCENTTIKSHVDESWSTASVFDFSVTNLITPLNPQILLGSILPSVSREIPGREIITPPPRRQPLWLQHCSLTYYG